MSSELLKRLPERGTPEREHFLTRILSDTGAFAREVLGFDTDRDAHGNALDPTQIGKGGIRNYGPHQEMVEFLDGNEEQSILLMAPRAAYKSSLARAFIMRKICAHPNISILLAMHDQELAEERCRSIRDELVNNPILRELFPNMKGPKWAADRFVTGLRTDFSGDSPTLFVCSPKVSPTSTRPHIIIFDDIVTEEDLSDTALAAGRRLVEKCLALEARGAQLIDIGTPYHYADAHHMILDSPGWKKLTHLDVGFEVNVNDDKTITLSGEPRWPHLTKEFLEGKLGRGMTFPTFMSQYMLRVVSGTHQPFQRIFFQPTLLPEDELASLTGYLLNDIAQGSPEGEKPSAKQCNNCLIYIGIDHRNHVHLLDIEMGKWPMLEFCQRFMAMRDRWSRLVTHRCEVWEQAVGSQPYEEFIKLEERKRGGVLNTVWQKRHQGAANKKARIHGLEPRFQAYEVHVVNTVPRTWVNEGEKLVLWDPEGHTDPIDGMKYPGGTIVDHAIRFPYVGPDQMDFMDTLALVNAVDKKTGQTVCFHVKPSGQQIPQDRRRTNVQQQRSPRGAADRFFSRQRRGRRWP